MDKVIYEVLFATSQLDINSENKKPYLNFWAANYEQIRKNILKNDIERNSIRKRYSLMSRISTNLIPLKKHPKINLR